MNITLKSVNHNERLSRDSHCFSATLYIDNKKVFGVMDDGWGGCMDTFTIKGGVKDINAKYAEIDAELKKTKIRSDMDLPELDNCLEFVVGDLVNEFLRDREIKKNLRTITYMNGDKMYGVKLKPTPENLARIKTQKWWEDSFLVLNNMPIDEVRQYYT